MVFSHLAVKQCLPSCSDVPMNHRVLLLNSYSGLFLCTNLEEACYESRATQMQGMTEVALALLLELCESPGDFVKVPILIWWFWGGAWDPAFLASPQVIPIHPRTKF